MGFLRSLTQTGEKREVPSLSVIVMVDYQWSVVQNRIIQQAASPAGHSGDGGRYGPTTLYDGPPELFTVAESITTVMQPA